MECGWQSQQSTNPQQTYVFTKLTKEVELNSFVRCNARFMGNKIENDCLFIDVNLIELLLMTPEGEVFITGVKIMIRKYRGRQIGEEV